MVWRVSAGESVRGVGVCRDGGMCVHRAAPWPVHRGEQQLWGAWGPSHHNAGAVPTLRHDRHGHMSARHGENGEKLAPPPSGCSPASAPTSLLSSFLSTTLQQQPSTWLDSRYLGDHTRHKNQSKILCIHRENNAQVSVKNRFRKQKFRK